MTSKRQWLLALGIALAFVAGYAGAVFSKRAPVDRRPDPFLQLRSRIGQPLPAARFIGPGEARIPDDSWRKGKVVLVLLTTECGACLAEGEFLRTLAGKRKDVKFLGVLSFEQDERSLRAAQTIFPFQVVRDDRMELIRALGLSGVPVKIYLEDGVVKQTWGGASLDAGKRASFTEWLTRGV
jgi:hypothetical protein